MIFLKYKLETLLINYLSYGKKIITLALKIPCEVGLKTNIGLYGAMNPVRRRSLPFSLLTLKGFVSYSQWTLLLALCQDILAILLQI